MKKFTTDLIFILVGAIIIAFSYNLFLIPHRLVPGGIGGLSILIHHLVKTPVGLMIIVLNIPLFILGMKILGRGYGFRTLFGVTLSSVLIDLLSYVLKIGPATEDRILSAIYGGALLGLGLGIVFRGRGSTGGTDVIGQVINHYTNLSTGMGILITDFIIISLAGIIFKDIELSLYGYLTLFISSKVIDLVLEGWSYTRGLIIITNKEREIGTLIIKKFDRGVTELSGRGLYTRKERPVLFCVVTKREIPLITREIKEIDNDAFVVVTEIYEVLGRGFRSRI
ncbi:MAG TPA: YitT family protein [bacterium (Candidatus Stahlbacteria)]|nr:YitT family protein [Candidatus Stahlbacteria bacterium]